MGRVRTPTILQMEATECGAAALGSILGFHGAFIPLEALRLACGVSRNGSKASNIVKAARNYGLDADGYEAEIGDLEELQPPYIVHWEFNHFVVVEKLTRRTVYINDPATGPRKIPFDEFDRNYTGIALLFEKTAAFKKVGKPKSIFSLFKNRVKMIRTSLSFLVLVTLFLIVPAIIVPGFSKIFIDNLLIQGHTNWIIPLLFGMLMVNLLQTLLVFLQNRYLLKLQIKLMLNMGAKFIWHLFRLPMPFFFQRFSGDIGDRVNANNAIAELLSAKLTSSIAGIFSMVFFAVILLFINWMLAAIGIVIASLNFIILWKATKKISHASRYVQQQQGRLTGIEMNGLQMIESIKATSGENDFFHRWAGRHAHIINANQRIALYNQMLMALPALLTGLSNISILVLGSWLIMQGELTVGTLVAFQSLLLNFISPLRTLLELGNQLQNIQGNLMRIDDVYNYPMESKHLETPQPASLNGTVKLSDITFGYGPLDPPIIENLSISVAPGQHIAIIGRTGCGKSTIAKLISSLYHPWKGKVSLDNRSIAFLDSPILAKTLAYVEQDIFLFEGSVRENLTLWDRSVDDEKLYQALQLVEMNDVLAARGGLDCLIQENGKNFSGGQQQRLEIARALVRKPKILILDEATSALDPPLEHRIFNRLKENGLTLIIITHRLSAIKDLDQIFIIDEGKIIHQGRHAELKEVEYYRQLVSLD